MISDFNVLNPIKKSILHTLSLYMSTMKQMIHKKSQKNSNESAKRTPQLPYPQASSL